MYLITNGHSTRVRWLFAVNNRQKSMKGINTNVNDVCYNYTVFRSMSLTTKAVISDYCIVNPSWYISRAVTNLDTNVANFQQF